MTAPNSAGRVGIETIRIPMADDVTLSSDVIRAGNGLAPVLLIRTPYGRAAARSVHDVVGLARSGWAVVVQDTRGRGSSTGDGSPFVHERADGRDTVAWCSAQPWSDGRVAMIGASYLGFTQWQAAASRAPALRAIAPTQAFADPRPDCFYEGDVFKAGFAAMFATGMAMNDPTTTPAAHRRLVELASDPQDTMTSDVAQRELAQLYPPYRRWLGDPAAEFWAETEASENIAGTTVAGYHVVGWHDLFCESGLRLWRQLRDTAATEYARHSQRLIVGHWPHGLLSSVTPGLDFGPGSDILAGAHRDMAAWLRDAVEARPVQAGVRVFVMGSNTWRELPDWPPPATEVVLFLSAVRSAVSRHGDGELSSEPPPELGQDRFRHDPADPVPVTAGRVLGLWLPVPGPGDQRSVEDRADVLVFSTAPLTCDVTVMGQVQACIGFQNDVGSVDLTAKLVDVYPDGRALNVVDSILRTRSGANIPASATLGLGSTAQVFRRGHRIRLEIAASSSPQFQAHPTASVQTVFYGGASASRLVLPVIDGVRGLAATTAAVC